VTPQIFGNQYGNLVQFRAHSHINEISNRLSKIYLVYSVYMKDNEVKNLKEQEMMQAALEIKCKLLT